MLLIPVIEIFVRHSTQCEHRGDERWKRCRCRKHLRWTWNGKQERQSAKTRSWEAAERAKRALELRYETAQLGAQRDASPASIEEAIRAFLAEKQGGRAALNTLAKYRLTLARLQEFCDRENLHFMPEVRLEHLSAWRAEWGQHYHSNFALRNNQSRVRHFFAYAHNAGMIENNPARKLSPIRITDEDFEVDPFSQQEYKKILETITTWAELSPVQRERLKALIQLQRWSGLSFVDAVCLERRELVKNGPRYRIDTRRRKTGAQVSNVIPKVVAAELLRLKTNSIYFFWSGQSSQKSATSSYDKLYRRLFRKAGIVNGGSHRLRHLFAVSLLEKGVDIRLVSRALGHKSVAITERYYAKWSRQQQVNLEKALASSW